MACGADDWCDMATFAPMKLDWLKTFLALPGGAPSHDTFRRVFELLDRKQFAAHLFRWTQALHEATGGKLIALDVDRPAPGDPTLRGEVVDRRACLADILGSLGRNGEAEPLQREAGAGAETLAKEYPSNDALISAPWARLAQLARIRHALGRREEAEVDDRRAIERLEDLHLRRPELALESLVQLYSACPVERLRDPQRALALERDESAPDPPHKSSGPSTKR